MGVLRTHLRGIAAPVVLTVVATVLLNLALDQGLDRALQANAVPVGVGAAQETVAMVPLSEVAPAAHRSQATDLAMERTVLLWRLGSLGLIGIGLAGAVLNVLGRGQRPRVSLAGR